MTAAGPIDFWFSIGSLYTYLSVTRLAGVEARTGVALRWRPFSIRAIMIEMDNIPAKQPVKLAYAWRDVERRAQEYGFAFRPRPPYPLKNFDLANRIAVVGAAEGWCAAYACAAYRRWFVDREEAGSERSNAQCLGEIGQDPRRVLERAASQDTAAAYEAATAQARGLGIFGVPTFATRGEIFWGDDRLESAIRWHQSG